MWRIALVALAVSSLAAPARAQGPESSELLVFINGVKLGSESVTLKRIPEGWLISGFGRLAPPLDLFSRRLSVRYDLSWRPLALDIDATVRGSALRVETTFSGTTAANTITQLGQTSQKNDTVSPDTLVLPNLFFGSYEALAARLAAMQGETGSFAAYIAPQAEIKLEAKRLETQTIETPRRALQVRRFAVTFANPGSPLAGEFWIDDAGRLLRFEVASQGLVVIRDDIAAVTTRRQNITRPGDEAARIPGNGFSLAGTVSKPAGDPNAKGRYPAIVLLPGSGPTDRDETVAGIPIFGQLAGKLADAGLLVLRYDKRGVGQSGGRAENSTLFDYAEDALAAVKWLREERKDVDDDRIAVLGHSEGAWVALVAASRDKDVAAVVLAAAPSSTGAELVLEQQARALGQMNVPEADRQARVDLQKRIQAAVLGQGDWTDVPDELRRQADTPWFRAFLAFSPAAILPKVRQPVLILQGELDTQVPPHHADKLADLAKARKKPGPDAVQVARIPGINHLLVPAETGEVAEYAKLADRTVSDEVAKATVEFLKKHMPGAR